MKKNRAKPPRLNQWILKKLLPSEERRYFLEGIEERYEREFKDRGRISALFWYSKDIICTIPLLIIDYFSGSIIMLKNYITITIRNIRKHKEISLINITGLIIGMVCCILILVYIGFELSFDRYHENANEIHRIAYKAKFSGQAVDVAIVPALMGPTLVSDIPEVLEAVRFYNPGDVLIGHQEKTFNESGLLYADNSVFNVFSFRLIKGNPKSVLEAPYTMVISQEISNKVFGNEDPIGKILKVNNEIDCTVTGIIEEPPSNSYFNFSMLASFETLYKTRPRRLSSWFNWDNYTYLLIQKDIDYKVLESKLVDFNQKHLGVFLKAAGITDVFSYFQPLTKIHLHSRVQGEFGKTSDIRYVYSYGIIAIFILAMACINFMNLATANSSKRAKEIGVRKVLGSKRRDLVLQFFGESLCVSIISILIAFIIALLGIPLFNSLIGQRVNIQYIETPLLIGIVLLIAIFVGLVSGIYPAFFLSAFKPVGVLKTNIWQGSKKSIFRKALVVFQFSISIALIVGTGIVFCQLKYMKKTDLGFNKDQLLVIPLNGKEIWERADLLKTAFASVKGVENSTISSMVPGEDRQRANMFYPEGWEQEVIMPTLYVDSEFLDTYEVEIIDGRGFSRNLQTDEQNAVLINESAVKKFGWLNPVGKKIEMAHDPTDLQKREPFTVIGVIKDINFRPLSEAIIPTVLRCRLDYPHRITLKMNSYNVSELIKSLEEKWYEAFPHHPFEYFFLDDFFDSHYRKEEHLGRLFRTFTLIAIFIGCLGLFGLASFDAEQRTKEIGIRKVLGAPSSEIAFFLVRDFMKWVLLANVIAWPLAYFAMNKWLQSYAYRIEIGIWIFILSALMAVAIAFFTISYKAVKAARVNPADSLRYE